MIRIHDTKDSMKYIKEVSDGWKFEVGNEHDYGYSTPNGYSNIPKEYVERALKDIEKIIPLHWCDLDIYIVPMLLMTYNEISERITGLIYLGRNWKGGIILGARWGDVDYDEVASTLIHELGHEIHYRFIDNIPFDLEDTDKYKEFKRLAKIEKYNEIDRLWHKRPTEILADTVRFFAGLQNPIFNHAPYDVFTGGVTPQKPAFDYVIGLIPDKDKVIEEPIKPIETSPIIPVQPKPEPPKKEESNPIETPLQSIDISKIKLIIDPGHGGKDNGASSFGYYEKDLNLVIAKRVKELLKEFKPDMTRINDITLEPNDRTPLIKDKYDYCISIHLNAGGGSGIETIHSIHSEKGKQLSQSIANHLTTNINIPIRRVFSRTLSDGRDYYYMHRNTGSTITVIAECLFLDNVENIKELNVENIAQGIANGWKEYVKNLTLIEPPKVDKPKEELKQPDKQLAYQRTLAKGIKGDDVKELQTVLKDLGFYFDAIDGSFGSYTDKCVRNFQSAYGLDVDGRVGKLTIGKINEVLSGEIEQSIYKNIRRFDSDIHILEVDLDYHVDVDLGKRGKLEKTSTIVSNKIKEGKKVVAGINGGFFNFDASSEHLGMYIDDGLYYTPPHNAQIDFIYFKDGHTEIHNHHGYDQKLLSNYQGQAYWAVGTSYSLIQNGKINLENKEKYDHANSRQPRTMIGQKKDGTFLLVVADGRSTNSKGLTSQQQAEIMLELGCHNSVNVDGGGSSTMVLSENGTPKVINKPSDGTERAVGSVFLVYKK